MINLSSSEYHPAQERLMYGTFLRKFFNWRLGDLNKKPIALPKDIQLPPNSALHIFDNVYCEDNHIPTSDVFPTQIPFIDNETFLRHVVHVKEPNITKGDVPIQYSEKYLLIPRDREKILRKFKVENLSKFRFHENVSTVPNTKNALTIFNYNPMYRIQIKSSLQLGKDTLLQNAAKYRKTRMVLSTILNTASKTAKDKINYIWMPLSNEIYSPQKFIRTKTSESSQSIRYKNSNMFALLVQLYNFVDTSTTLSVFEKMKDEDLYRINLILTVGRDFDNTIIINLKTLQELNPRNTNYRKIIKMINRLVLVSMKAEVEFNDNDDEEDIDRLARELHLEKEEDIDTFEDHRQEIEAKLKSTEEDEDVETSTVDKDKLIDDGKKIIQGLKSIGTIDLDIPESLDTIVVDNSDTDIIKTVTPTTKTDVDPDSSDKSKKIEPPKSKFFTKNELLRVAGNTAPATSGEEFAEFGMRYLKDIDSDADEYIAKQNHLSPKQKERATKLSRAYLNISLAGKPLSQHLTTGSDPTIDTEEFDFLNKDIPDKSMLKSTLQNFDNNYMKKFYYRDLAATLVSLNRVGMFVTGVEEQFINNELTQIKRFKIKFTDAEGEKHSSTVDIPAINEEGQCLVNGVNSYFRKQMINLPICKVSPSRVSLASNYNKTIVERVGSVAHSFLGYFRKLLMKIEESHKIKTIYGVNKLPLDLDNHLPGHEYSSIMQEYTEVELIHNAKNLTLYFDYEKRHYQSKFFSDRDISEVEQDHLVFCGDYVDEKNDKFCLFVGADNLILVVATKTKKVVGHTTFIGALTNLFDVQLNTNLTEWTDIKILDKKFPVGFLLAYKYGLIPLMDKLKMDYQIVPVRSREPKLSPTSIVLKFNDKKIIFDRYPLLASMIVSGLTFFDLRHYDLEDMYNKNTYINILQDKGYSPNYLRGIDATFDLFVDPITYDVLLQMGKPTKFDELLIEATRMLQNHEHKEPSSITNMRMRSFERLNAVLYNQLSRDFANYKKRKSPGTKFSINPQSVIQRILQDQAMVGVENINPIHDLKVRTSFTMTGVGGRSQEAFVVNDRIYPKDGPGILSEATPDSGAVAITATSPPNPTIANIRGFVSPTDVTKLEPSQLISVPALLMPASTQDDAKRTNMISIQLSHMLPTKEGSSFRTRTGYERVIAHTTSAMYAYTAKQDGQVIDVDDKLGTCKIQYKDGSKHVLNFGEIYGDCADMVTTLKLDLLMKKGSKFKRGDVITYNPEFFEYDPISKQIDWKHGVPARVAFVDCRRTFEDSSSISEELGKKLQIQPVTIRPLTLLADDIVHEYKKIGDHVEITDPLIIFESGENIDLASFGEDPETIKYLADLNKRTPKAKVAGKIVDIEAYYGCPISDMNPSMANLVKHAIKAKNAKAKFAQGTDTTMPQSEPLPEDTKFKNVKFTKNTVVIRYFIQENLDASLGDKIVIGPSLKSIIGSKLSPTFDEDNVAIDVEMSGSSVSNRIVNSVIIMGISETVLEKTEKDILEMYFD